MRQITAGILLVALSAGNLEAAAAGLRPCATDAKEHANVLTGGSRTPRAAAWRVAQVAVQSPQQYSSAQGMFDGEMYAENVGTGGKFAVGLVTGVLTGLLGTGVGYFLIGPADMNMRASMAVQGKGQDYLFGFQTGWEKKTRSKKRNAFLGGGVLGTVGFLVLYVASQGD
jgi:hypothetical protein